MSDQPSSLEQRVAAIRLRYVHRSRRLLARGVDRLGDAARDREAVQEVYRLAHRLAGSGSTFGFARVSQEAARLEAQLEPYARAGAHLDDPELLDHLRQTLSALRDVFTIEVSHEDPPRSL